MKKEIAEAVLSRANGACECGCGVSLGTFGHALDHFSGRGRVEDAVEELWALSKDCDYQKTNSIPSRVFWLTRWLAHTKRHGYVDQGGAWRCRMTRAEAGRKGGLKNKGENNPASKLTESQVKTIRGLRRDGFPRKWIAQAFRISVSHVTRLTTGRRWGK